MIQWPTDIAFRRIGRAISSSVPGNIHLLGILKANRVVIAWVFVLLALSSSMCYQNASPIPVSAQQNSASKETTMTKHASGTFDVKVIPQKPDNNEAETANLSRMSLSKQFHGDLEATSTGEMLAAGNPNNSGAYVALERVTGTLHGRTGTFVLQHNGTMTRGVPELMVKVVPEMGTGELAGIAGSMNIKIEGKQHFYKFDYTLPEGL